MHRRQLRSQFASDEMKGLHSECFFIYVAICKICMDLTCTNHTHTYTYTQHTHTHTHTHTHHTMQHPHTLKTWSKLSGQGTTGFSDCTFNAWDAQKKVSSVI